MNYALRFLNNYNFQFSDFDAATFYSDLSIINESLDSFLQQGWREKLLASYTIAFFDRKEYKDSIKTQFLKGDLSRDLKGFVVAIIKLHDKQEAEILFTEYLKEKGDSPYANWVLAGLYWLEEKNDAKLEKELKKIEQALSYINNFKEL